MSRIPFAFLASLALLSPFSLLTAQDAPEPAAPAASETSEEDLAEARKRAEEFVAELETKLKDVEANGETMEKLVEIGDMYLSIGEVERAIVIYERAIRKFGGTEGLFLKFSRVVLLSGRPELGIEVLTIGLEAFPESHLLNGELGKAYVASKKPYAAIAALKRAIELDPEEDVYKYHLADAYRSQHKWAQASEIIDSLIEKESEFLPIYLMKGDLLLAEGDERRGVRYLEDLYEQYPDSKDVKNLLVHGYQLYAYKEAEAGRLSRAIKTLEDALEVAPADAESMTSLGSFHYEAGEMEAAEAAYKKVLEATPEHLDVYVLYGTLLDFQDRKDELAAIYRQGLAQARQQGAEVAVQRFSSLLGLPTARR